MRYSIPRNVKKGRDFLGLELKGWLLFAVTLPFFIGLGWLSYLAVQREPVGFIIGGTFAGCMYYLCMIDERTGAMNGSFLVEMIRWLYSEKVQVFWEDLDNEKIHTLSIRVDFKKRETE